MKRVASTSESSATRDEPSRRIDCKRDQWDLRESETRKEYDTFKYCKALAVVAGATELQLDEETTNFMSILSLETRRK